MAIVQLQKSLFATTTTTTSSCSCFLKNSSLASFQRLALMAKLQCRAFQSQPGTHLSFSPFGLADGYGKISQLRFRKHRVSSMIVDNQSKVLRLKEFYPSRSSAYGPGSALVQSQFRFGFSNTGTQAYVLRYGSLDGGTGFSLSSCGNISKRFFSEVPRVMDKKDNAVLRDGRSGNASSIKGFNRRWKWRKRFAANSKNNTASSKASASKDVGKLTPAKQLAEDGKKDVNKDPKAKVKAGKHSKNKKNKEQLPDNSASASSDAARADGSKGVSKARKANTAKSGQPKHASAKTVSGNTLMEACSSPTLGNAKSKKTTENSSSKMKSVKEGYALIQSDEACTKADAIKAPQNQKSNISGKTKHQGQSTLKPLYPPTGKSVVVVESVTKAKVIQGYLGDLYEVLPSYGHVRDLAARSGSVRPDDDFTMVWEVPSAAWTHLKSIKVALNGAENLILASDPDREGEAIAWHIIEMLQQQAALREDITVTRVVFHEITETSIKSALQAPRDIDVNLVHAYLARRALDYLIGFNISPLLWRKLPGCQSAGRVQSAALSLICDREMEIDDFKPQEYWTIDAMFKKNEMGSSANYFSFRSYLTHFGSKKLNQLSISSHVEAKDVEQKTTASIFEVVGCKKNKIRKNPPTPYITSTLQQDAANKLHFTATYTMKLAQKLYEGIQLADGQSVGIITYIRTDGLHISNDAVKDIRSLAIERYGPEFVSDDDRKYYKKVKNAQEAHEAIRPTDIQRLPSTLVGILDKDSLRLYALIWSRTMACQMEPATIDQIQVDIGSACASISFRSTCSRVGFSGYQTVYGDVESEAIQYLENEGNDRDETFNVLSSLKRGDRLCLGEVELKQHHTQPPPRYSEASLVKKLEELGIGRPSTYAATIKVLQDRNYVTVKSRVLYPEFRGRMVSVFLAHHFSEVTDYSFTADMETELDNVSAGLTEWKGLLKDYWTRFSTYCNHVSKVHIHQVEKLLEKTFGHFLFSSLPDKSRTCPSCLEGTLIFKVSRFGAGYFIGCDQHPKCKYIAKTLYGDEEEEVAPRNNGTVEEPKLLGTSPVSNEKILLKNGPYGFYVQLGEDRKGYLPKRASVAQRKDVGSITLEDAIELLRYPVTLGNHPEDGQPVVLKLAKVGFSIRHRRTIAPVPKNMKPNDINLEKALKLLSSKDVKRCGRPKNKPKLEAVEAM